MYVVYDYLVEYVDDDSGRVTGAVCVNDDSSGLNFGLWRTCRPRWVVVMMCSVTCDTTATVGTANLPACLQLRWAPRDISLLLFLSRLLHYL